jgi:ribosomal protein S12 methylthiotransferase accessory factor
MGLKIRIINKNKISEPHVLKMDDFLNYKEMISYLGYFNLIKKLDVVMAPSSELPLYIGNCEFMNINYLFNYLLDRTSMSVKLNESIFAGGKGFTMYKAICSSLGEAFERFMACLEYFYEKDNIIVGSYNELEKMGYSLMDPEKFEIFSDSQFEEDNFLFDRFDKDSVVSWIKMKELLTEKEVYLPACLILMYYKPVSRDEKRIGYATSGGLTSHFTDSKGTEHGLLEIIERHEINLSWYCRIPPKRIKIDDIQNKKLLKYGDYIKEKNIQFYRHNVDQENYHVITAMSFDEDMTKYSFNAGGGIDQDIETAILSAIEEYTQAVNNTRKIVYAPNWLTSRFSNGVLDVQEGDDPKRFKTFYQAVSYYGLKCYQQKLDWYVKENEEITLSEIRNNQPNKDIIEYVKENSINPLYSKLNVTDSFKHIYISKVYMTEFSPAFIAGVPAVGHSTYKKYLGENECINREILPFP